MPRFLHRRRRFVGEFRPPPPKPPAPVDRVVEEGVLIAESGVRMSLRNRIIVDVLRDRRDLDRAALERVAAAGLEAAADQERESAQRSRLRPGRQQADDPVQESLGDSRESERRARIHEELSRALAKRAADREALAAIVERSREEAWSEIGRYLADRLARLAEPIPESEVRNDPEYSRDRTERMAVLVALDLAALAEERGLSLEELGG